MPEDLLSHSTTSPYVAHLAIHSMKCGIPTAADKSDGTIGKSMKGSIVELASCQPLLGSLQGSRAVKTQQEFSKLSTLV